MRGQRRSAWRGQAFETPTDWSNDGDHKDPLGSNESRPLEALFGPEVPAGLPQALLPTAPDVVRYTQKDMDHLLQTFFQALKDGSGNKLKAKISDVYCGRSHIEYYNFCQQCENHFTTCEANGPNRIPFVASFLRNRINFRWQQHKQKLEVESLVPISWDKFKAFLRKALGESWAFVDSYWTKIRRDS